MPIVLFLETAMLLFLPGETPKFVGLEVAGTQVPKPSIHHSLAEFGGMKHDPDYGFLFHAN
jgi:hypothetical protein